MTVAIFLTWDGGETECRIISGAKIVRPLFSEGKNIAGLNVDGVDIIDKNFGPFEIKDDLDDLENMDKYLDKYLDKYKEEGVLN